VAREGAAADPPIPAPPRLRPVLHFSRLNPKSLDVVRRTLEEDDDFRARVAGAVDEGRAGRAGWLWLHRPEGWEGELSELEEIRSEADAEADLARRLRKVQREVEAARIATQRAEDGRRAAEEDAARARADLDVERRARRSSEERVAGLEARLRESEHLRAAAEREAEGRADEVRQLEERLAEAGRAAESEAAPEPEPEVARDTRHLTDALLRARRATEIAARALADAASEVDAVPAKHAPAPSPPRRVPRARRRAARRLPPPLVDNTTEAILHLVRQPGATVLVDGYNISMAAWPGTPIAVQRERLVDALDALHARFGPEVVVVFDGDTGGRRPSSTQGRAIKAFFTNAGEIADDRIVAMVSAIPDTAPVLVVTSDRELKDRARAAGAHVASARPFLSVLLR
jgi:predicted RNA-binding protein with PIN domain